MEYAYMKMEGREERPQREKIERTRENIPRERERTERAREGTYREEKQSRVAYNTKLSQRRIKTETHQMLF
jgi:hypothetical protein